MSDINWDEAPEGATHHINVLFDKSLSEFVTVCNNGRIKYLGISKKTMWGHNTDKDKCFEVTAKPLLTASNVTNKNKKPTYTQEMADNGELPQVGMLCEFKHGGYDTEGTVTAITKEYIVLTECTGKERIRKLSESPIKPIDTRTDKEKAMQSLADAYLGKDPIRNVNVPYPSVVCDILNDIIAGQIHGVKWVSK